MNSTARAAAAAPVKFIVSVRSGPDKGAIYQLLPPRATIGRGSTNDIPLSDPRCSRNQAVIEFVAAGAVVRDLSERGSLAINGISMREAPLRDGDVVRVGDTELAYRVEGAPRVELALAPPSAQASPIQADPWGAPRNAPYRAGPAPQNRARPKAPESDGRLRFYLIVLIVGGALAWMVLSAPKPTNVKPTIRTSADVDTEIVNIGKRVDDVRKKIVSPEAKQRMFEADRHFREGFRDLQDGYYDRAMRSFETSLALEPRHELAAFYYGRAKTKREALVSDWMKSGRQYREKNMYARCMGDLDKAIKSIPNPQDPRRRESQALWDECQALMESN